MTEIKSGLQRSTRLLFLDFREACRTKQNDTLVNEGHKGERY